MTYRGPYARSDKCAVLTIFGPHGEFDVLCYGLTSSDLATIPNDYLPTIRKRLGLDDNYSSSPLTIRSIR